MTVTIRPSTTKTSTTNDPGADAYVPGHGDLSFDVARYDLELDYRIDTNRLSGRAMLSAVARREITRFGLDLEGLRIAKLTVNANPATRYVHRRGRVLVTPGSTLLPGEEFSVAVSYGGAPAAIRGPDGVAGWEELADGVIVASQPHGAPSWFPCNDRPSNKARYRIAVTTSSDHHVVANGVLTGRKRAASGTTWVYEQVEPMAPYLATVQIGRYVSKIDTASPVPLRLVYPRMRARQVGEAFARQGEMITTFARLFGPYPFVDYTVVVTNDSLEIPVESQGMSIFGSNFLRPGWESERLIAHELAHQWFGNSLTVRYWRDIWLHEGFACYSEWLWSEASGGPPAAEHAAKHWRRLAALPKNLRLGDPGATTMFDDRVYKRGALTLHALRTTIGDAAFFGLLRSWVAAHAHGSVSTTEFTAFASTYTRRPLDAFFKAWLVDLALPRLPLPTGPKS
jgi:aminopeptidase N